MTLSALLDDLARLSVELVLEGDRLRCRAPNGALTPALIRQLADHKAAIIAVLQKGGPIASDPGACSTNTPGATGVPTSERTGSVDLSGKTYHYLRSWDQEVLGGEVLSLDTETAPIAGHEIPPLALASASSGSAHCLIHPERLGSFLLAHKDRHLVFHNVAFDFWVVAAHLASRGERAALGSWWEIAHAGRMHDTMLLDMLVRLGKHGAYPSPRNLALVAKEQAGVEISKDDPYRLRYGEIIGKDWRDLDEGFFSYAIADAIATRLTWDPLQVEAKKVAAGVSQKAIEKHGLLTETIQVKAAIALAAISRNGLHLDLAHADSVRRGYAEQLARVAARLQAEPGCEGLLPLDRAGQIRRTKSGAPSLSQKVLREVLTRVAAQIAAQTGEAVRIPLTPRGSVSTSTREWADHADDHPFLKDWTTLAETAKLIQFFTHLGTEVVHPRYTVLVRTGRTSCSEPNIQQIPRKGGLREIFVASPGHLLLAIDYSFIELRTLAAICEEWYGRSKLAEVIRQGTDPHAYTAAMLLGIPLEAFMALSQSDPGRYKHLRQKAKPLNFGIPGGLGAASLVHYAHATYGVELSLDEARGFRDRLVREVYPELALYLSEDSMTILARNLGARAEDCWRRFDWKGDRSPAVAGGIRNVVVGKTHKADGKPYSTMYCQGVWDGLRALNRNSELGALLAGGRGSEELCTRLFRSGIATPTGRVRGRVSYCQARNTPFQGLAADGAKLALWNLIREGFRVVGFVHDEVLVELPDRGGDVAIAEARRVEAILCQAMSEVTGSIPVACELALGSRWSKDATPITQEDRLCAEATEQR